MTDEKEFGSPAVAGQKRGNTNENGGPASKRANVASDPEVQVKVLIPAGAVGALIGKGGESMRSLKNESGCRVQMSKNQEHFQNTNERICLVKGKVTSAMIVMKAILEKIQEKIEPNAPSDQFDLKGVDRCKEMKIVVPNTSAGMVIGKSGASIKEIRESAGANIQVYPKAGSEEAKQSVERVITVGADKNEVVMDAIQRVLEKVAADPMHAQEGQKQEFSGQSSTSFSGFGQQPSNPTQFGGGGGISNFPSSNPVWQSQSTIGSRPSYQQTPVNPSVPDNSFSKPASSYPQIKYNGIPVLNNNEVLSFLDNLQNTLRTSGFTESAVGEIMQAMQVLARYNIMGLGLGLGVATMAQSRTNETVAAAGSHTIMQPAPQPVQQMPTQRYDLTHTQPPTMLGAPNNGGGVTSLLDSHDGRQEKLSGNHGVLIDVLSQNSSSQNSGVVDSFASSVVKVIKSESELLELEVPDTQAGAILGPKAKTLVEIQKKTGCKVEVHKRDAGLAPSGYRRISLTGDANAIASGRQMINLVINNEQARRQQQSLSNPIGMRAGF